ncbi:MAG: ATP-binding protein, partial [Candidatus Xenobia bacterium]
RGSWQELETRLQREMEQLDVNSESDLETLISRFKEYQGHMSRLNSARRVLKSHQMQSRGEDGQLLTDLERSQQRVAELEKRLGAFVARLPEEGEGEDVVNELVEGFRNHRRRRQEIARVNQRLAKLPDEEAFAATREEHNQRLTQAREELGVAAGEPIEKLLHQWREYEKLMSRMEVEQRIVRSHEEEFVETGAGKKVPRMDWLKRRLNKLEKELGEFARSHDFETLIEQVTEQRNLIDRRDQVLQILENLPPMGEIDREEAAHIEERAHAIDSLGLPSGDTPDFTWLEDQFERYLQLLDRCEGKRATLRALLEERTEDGVTTSTLDRMESLLGELRKGLGSFYNAQNIDDVLKDYNGYAALKEEISITKRNLAGMQGEDELLARIEELELQRMNAREELGLLPEEDIGHVLVLYREYVRLVARKRTQEEVRTKLLSTVSLPPDFETPRVADKVLTHLQQQLDELRTHLGGFEEAGEEATDDVIGQFREAQRLRRDIDGRKAQIKKLRTEEEMEQEIEEARQPMLAAEAKLVAFGDLSDVDALRGRYQEWSGIVSFMATTERALAEHPTVDALGEEMMGVDRELDDCKERIAKLLEERSGLAKYRKRTPAQVEEARPVLEHQISRARENQDAISHELEKVQTALRTLVQPASSARGNLEVLDEQIRRVQRELDRLGRQRDGIETAVDMLEAIVKQTQETLVPSLQIRASDILNQLTGGKYPSLELEGTHLSPVVKSKSGAKLKSRQLSGGLRDQVFFALRAAMAWEMSGTANLPFILDDPFVQFDAERLALARRYLGVVQERHQVILLTRDERCRDWGEVVLDLRGSEPTNGTLEAATEVDVVTTA